MLNANQFDRIVRRLPSHIKALDSIIQQAAVFAVHQSIEHRNATPANSLYQAVVTLKGVVRADSLARFLEQHGQLAYMKATKTIEFFEVKDATFDEKQLMALPWRQAIAPKDPESVYDAKEMFESLLARIEKKIQAGKDEVKNADLVKKMRAVMAEGALEDALQTIQAS